MSDDALRALRSVIGLVGGVLLVIAVAILCDWQDRRDLLKQASALQREKER